jgi:hypothetical protein
VTGDLRAALGSLGSCLAFHSRDWGEHPRDAWIYGIAIGWDCEDGRDDPDHEHDDICGGAGGMLEMAGRHGWTDDEVARLRSYREAVAAELGLLPMPALATTGEQQ